MIVTRPGQHLQGPGSGSGRAGGAVVAAAIGTAQGGDFEKAILSTLFRHLKVISLWRQRAVRSIIASMKVLMIDTGTEAVLVQHVQRSVVAVRGQLYSAPAGAFWIQALDGCGQGAHILGLPFSQVSPIAAQAVQRLWSWEGPAMPCLFTQPDSDGARLLARLAPGLLRKGAPWSGVESSANEKLLWLPVRSLTMQAVIALTQVQRGPCRVAHTIKSHRFVFA